MQNNCSFLLAKNDKNYVEYMAMCGIFSKVRDISSTLCYNVIKVRSVYKKRSGFFLMKTVYQANGVSQISQFKERNSKNG